MPIEDIHELVEVLEKAGELKKITTEVDSELELAEILRRTMYDNGPALLFENVKGSSFPVATNLFGSEERLRLALGCNPKELGEEILSFAEKVMPPKLDNLFKSVPFIRRLTNFRSKEQAFNPPCQQIEDTINLEDLPIIKCWPEDGGRFITMGLTITESPINGKSNMGMYRLQMHEKDKLGMHWHPHKGGATHYHEAKQLGQTFPAAIVLGGDPSLIFAAIAPLPENINELLFSAFLKRKPITLCKAKTVSYTHLTLPTIYSV